MKIQITAAKNAPPLSKGDSLSEIWYPWAFWSHLARAESQKSRRCYFSADCL